MWAPACAFNISEVTAAALGLGDRGLAVPGSSTGAESRSASTSGGRKIWIPRLSPPLPGGEGARRRRVLDKGAELVL